MALQSTDVDVSDAAATPIAAGNARRTLLAITNMGPNPVCVGGPDVTGAEGLVLAASVDGAPGGQLILTRADADAAVTEAWYAVALSAAQTGDENTYVLEAIG